MGGCFSGNSGATYVDDVDGTEEDFHSRYFEDRVLGEGEFGVVKLVHDMQQQAHKNSNNNNNNGEDSQHNRCSNDHREPLACKIIRKGIVFKDNTLYAPLKPQVLKMECNILRTLAGQHYCLKLCAIYESPRLIYILTEYCSGGSMLKYVVSVHGQEEDATTTSLRSEDVSRIAFQLLDAIHHCASHRIIHRDIKPDNIMFRHPTPGAELRLIDFGSGAMDAASVSTPQDDKQQPTDMIHSQVHDLQIHTTFAGSGFYISPELYQKEYTYKTDVWSAGVVLYVLVAGYPADDLQMAFNLLQRPKRNLRKLPNLPHNLPDSFYDLLDGLLVYQHEHRKAAGDFLTHEFVQFHKHLLEEEDDMVLTVEQIAAEAAGIRVVNDSDNTTNERKRLGRIASVPLSGSVARHTIFLGYQKFERAVTTLLAALLTKPELDQLLKKISETTDKLVVDNEKIEVDKSLSDAVLQGQKLQIIPIHQLKAVLRELNHERALSMIDKLPDAGLYEYYAYHLALLRQFAREANDAKGSRRRGSSRKYQGGGDTDAAADTSNSNRSTGSLKPFRSSNKNDTVELQKETTSSVHGNNVYEGWTLGKLQNPRRPPQRTASVPVTSVMLRDPTL